MVYRGAMRIKCLAQGPTTKNSSEIRFQPPTNLLIVIREAYPLDHRVLRKYELGINFTISGVGRELQEEYIPKLLLAYWERILRAHCQN